MKIFQIAKSIGGTAVIALGSIGAAVAGPEVNLEAKFQGGSFCAIEGDNFSTDLVPSRTDQAVLGSDSVNTNIRIRQNNDTEWSFSDLSSNSGGVNLSTSSMTVDVFGTDVSTGNSETVSGAQSVSSLRLTEAIMNGTADFVAQTEYDMNATLTCVADSASPSDPQLCYEDGELTSCSED